MIEQSLRSSLLFLSRQQGLKDVAVEFSPLRQFSERFVAGETVIEAVKAAKKLGKDGLTASFDHLGEEVASEEETLRELAAYRQLLTRIHQEKAPANVSVKLTQLGLALDFSLALKNARELVGEAKKRGIFVRLDMEGSAYTSGTLALYRRLREDFDTDDVGVVLQSALRRTASDLESMLELGARIRLCKGAYREPAEIAYPDKKDVDDNYVALMKRLLESGGYHGIATHDERIVHATLDHAKSLALPSDAFEFQMLYGVRRDLQQELVRAGHRVRIYVPYGDSWYPYLMRRIAERPANLWFVMKNALRG